MDPLSLSIAYSGLTLMVIGAVCAYVHQQVGMAGLRAFSIGFGVASIAMIVHAVGVHLELSWWELVSGMLMLVSTSAFIVGGFRIARRTVPVALRVFVALNVVWVPVAVALELPSEAVMSPLLLALNGSVILAGAAILRSSPAGVGTRLAGGGLALLGVYALTYPIQAQVPEQLHWGFLVASAINVIAAIGLVVIAFERARDEVEATERKLASARRMEAIGTLAGGVAHDFNNLLTVILVNLELLRTEAEGPSDRETLDIATQAVQQASRLTAQLLAVGRRTLLHP